jgi:hypothetical protein
MRVGRRKRRTLLTSLSLSYGEIDSSKGGDYLKIIYFDNFYNEFLNKYEKKLK